jgi:hypothetical protein
MGAVQLASVMQRTCGAPRSKYSPLGVIHIGPLRSRPQKGPVSKRTQKTDRPSPAMEAFSLYAVEAVEYIGQTNYLRIVQTTYLWEGL